ncbi:electron transport complex subunit RsxC [uncultured Muribaculum sp.]|uniref:electron transport complex subunit RsxC n=1 Tax=uncultured Muribaculum sp. TaxID=1918613 RepID=UPI0025D375F6|nr:electron transport complex subunit RsxC [uncultured Muribaculum sp.]
MRTFHIGGVHPPENKITASARIIDVELPREVTLTYGQHIGAPAKCELNKGDHVDRGDIIAVASGFVSANVHTPISGTVVKIDKIKAPNGMPCDAVTIAATDDDHEKDLAAIADRKPLRTEPEIASLDAKKIIEIIDHTGIVGLGGATFPTKVKLSPPPGMKADIVIINAVECEPYLTNDHALMLECPDEILEGVRLLMRAAGVDRATIGVEANKKNAIELLRSRISSLGIEGISVMELEVKYPQGGEKQLIQALTGKEVPSGALPIATGAIVQNVATAYAVYDAVRFGQPLIDRVVTITGPSVERPGNYRAAIGISIEKLIEMAGGVPSDTGKIVLGGPMMGKSIVNIDAPTTKGVSGILMLPENMSERGKTEPCIRCAKCVSACPMGLEPYLLATLSRLGEWEEVEKEKVMNCMECGCCSFTCPSSRPILDFIRLGKQTVGAAIRARQSQKK